MPNILNIRECPIKLRVCHQNESYLLRPNSPQVMKDRVRKEKLSFGWNTLNLMGLCRVSGTGSFWPLLTHRFHSRMLSIWTWDPRGTWSPQSADLCMAMFLFFRLWWAEYFTLLTTTCISTLGSSSPASVGSPARAGPITTGELRWGSSSRTSKCRRSSLDSTSPWPF